LNRTYDAIATLLIRGIGINIIIIIIVIIIIIIIIIDVERCLMWILALVRTKERGQITLGHTIVRHTKRDLDEVILLIISTLISIPILMLPIIRISLLILILLLLIGIV